MKYTISLSSDEVLRVIIKHVEDITGLNAVDAKIKLDVDYFGPPTWVLKSVDVEVKDKQIPHRPIREVFGDPEDELRYKVWKGIYPEGTK